ncbi:MAG: hypothetical protein ACXVWF_00855 [Actinomycetota bacterium]
MWVFPLVAAVVAFVFAGSLAKQYLQRRRLYQLLWALALLQFGVASLAVVVGVANGWTRTTFEVYWALGAVLNVPFLAAGEIVLLFRQRWVQWAVWLVLVFSVAYTIAVLRGARPDMNMTALTEQLPSGKDVFGGGTAAHALPQYFSYPTYFILLAGTAWSAWKMRGHPELKDRFIGTLLIAVGATIVAGGATFAAFGILPGFVATLVIGIAAMFWGFLRASRPPAPAPTPAAS